MHTPPPEPNYAAARNRVSQLRAERGWTYDELAERTGVSRPVLVDVEAGRSRGHVGTWHALAHVYAVPLGDLLGCLCEGHPAPDEAALW